MREWGIPLSEIAAYVAYLPPEAATPWVYERDQEKAKTEAKEVLVTKPAQLPIDDLNRRLGISKC